MDPLQRPRIYKFLRRDGTTNNLQARQELCDLLHYKSFFGSARATVLLMVKRLAHVALLA